MYVKKLPKEERPIEKAEKYGIESLSNSEILALIIHTGTKSKSAIDLAENIIAMDSSGIRYLGTCECEELKKISGIGPAKAMRILASVELGKRIASSYSRNDYYIKKPQDVVNLLMEDLRYMNKEYFKALILNAKGKVIYIDTVSIGDMTRTMVHPREVFKKAIRKDASSIVISHNHPSGDPTPSSEDIMTTKKLVKVGEMLGIPVLDHIVIGDGSYISLKEEKLM